MAGWLSRDRREVRTAANLGLAGIPLAGLAEALARLLPGSVMPARPRGAGLAPPQRRTDVHP